ncbi:hypothetical protein FXB39_13045 [Nocardioides sp. BGMRC 2183]|nr:hypothetical protein FXB39_13045 [Nocardioides sp. BGMRC 2183]
MSRSTPNGPRRPSSRGTTPRPRKLAGQTRSSEPEVTADDTSIEDASSPEEDAGVAPTEGDASVGDDGGSGGDSGDADDSGDGGDERLDDDDGNDRRLTSVVGSARMTRGLLVVLTLLALVLVGQTVWFVLGDDEASARADDAPISVPEDRPIQMNASDAQSGAEAAATALVDIVARKSKSYDEDVAKASESMTERFAAEYQETTDQIRDEFVASQTDVQARVVGQGVVRASPSEMEVLVFLNQYVTKGEKKERKTTYAPYRAVVTVVNTDRGWLVDGLATK